jgi:hypothetical protein
MQMTDLLLSWPSKTVNERFLRWNVKCEMKSENLSQPPKFKQFIDFDVGWCEKKYQGSIQGRLRELPQKFWLFENLQTTYHLLLESKA